MIPNLSVRGRSNCGYGSSIVVRPTMEVLEQRLLLSFTTIDVPGSFSTLANGINDAGQVVGTYTNSAGTFGFLESGGSYTTIDVPGATRTEANGINDAGQVVGTYVTTQELTAASWSPTVRTPRSTYPVSPMGLTTPAKSWAVTRISYHLEHTASWSPAGHIPRSTYPALTRPKPMGLTTPAKSWANTVTPQDCTVSWTPAGRTPRSTYPALSRLWPMGSTTPAKSWAHTTGEAASWSPAGRTPRSTYPALSRSSPLGLTTSAKSWAIPTAPRIISGASS